MRPRIFGKSFLEARRALRAMKKRRIKTRTKVSENREETNAPETVVRCFAVARIKREENRRRMERKREVYPGFFVSLSLREKKSKGKKILFTLQVLKRAPVGLLHDDRLPPRWFDSALSLRVLLLSFFWEVEACARCACLLSNECGKRERGGGCFFR
jgi:hypothetical protein